MKCVGCGQKEVIVSWSFVPFPQIPWTAPQQTTKDAVSDEYFLFLLYLLIF